MLPMTQAERAAADDADEPRDAPPTPRPAPLRRRQTAGRPPPRRRWTRHFLHDLPRCRHRRNDPAPSTQAPRSPPSLLRATATGRQPLTG